MDPSILLAAVGALGLVALLLFCSFAARDARPRKTISSGRRRQRAWRNGTFRDVNDDGSDDPLTSNDFDGGDSDAERLQRAADRFENAGDTVRAQQARDAAANLAAGVQGDAAALSVADLLDPGSDAGSSASFTDNS